MNNTERAAKMAGTLNEIAERLIELDDDVLALKRQPGTSVVASSTLNRLLRAAEDAVKGQGDGKTHHGFEEHVALRRALAEFRGANPKVADRPLTLNDLLKGEVPPVVVPRIILRPGNVVSRTDGDRHYVSSGRLEALYRLTPEERRRAVTFYTRDSYLLRDDDIVLRPRVDGNYDRVAVGLDPKPIPQGTYDATFVGIDLAAGKDTLIAQIMAPWGPMTFPIEPIKVPDPHADRRANVPLGGRSGWNRWMVRLDPPRAGLLTYWAPTGYRRGDRVVVPYGYDAPKLGTLERPAHQDDRAKLGTMVLKDVIGKVVPA